MFRNLLTFLMIVMFASAIMAADSTEVKKEAAPEVTKVEKQEMKEAKKEMKLAELEMTDLPTGVKYFDLVVGEGKECKKGTRVDCHYTLWFADENGEKGKRFQSSKDGGKSFQCTLGQGLIPGWSDGMSGMKEGGTRLIFIPYDQGYGKGGGPIPGNTNLVFEIEFLKALN